MQESTALLEALAAAPPPGSSSSSSSSNNSSSSYSSGGGRPSALGSDTATAATAEPFDYDGGAEVAAAAAASRLLASMARAGAVQEQAVPDVGGGHGVAMALHRFPKPAVEAYLLHQQ